MQQTERGKVNLLSPLELRHLSAPVLKHLHPGSLAFRLRPGLTPSAPNSLAFGLELNYTSSAPGSAYGWQNMRLLGLQGHISQSLSSVSIYTHWFCFSEEP